MMRKWEDAMNNKGIDSFSNYGGDDFTGWYMCVGRSRDSGVLEESNFETALKQLGGESDTVQIIRFGHWGVGWIEELMIHESDTKSVDIGNEIRKCLEDYPVLDEEDYSERKFEKAFNYWNSMSIRERVDILENEDMRGIPIFAARHELSEIMRKYDTTCLWDYLTTE